ncbi:MAG: hypothetical protein HPY60_10850 [Candidatus Methanofastidiosum sp.]|nr:hypothetical protein [Methanofastidiosum sp.]NYT13631.1 hypothetical protein [Candidatus Methanofastidiosa archaeon]
MNKDEKIFLLFGILQSITLGTIIFLIFRGLNIVGDSKVISFDTQLLLSTLFPAFLLIVEYMIYSKK